MVNENSLLPIITPVFVNVEVLGVREVMCGDNFYSNYIYAKESTCDIGAVNKISGACGIGQALPCSKLTCSLYDYKCQNKWFNDYAKRRYGSWEKAYNWWVAHDWW